MSQKLPYGTKTLYTKFELDLWDVRMGANSFKYENAIWGQKMKFSIVFILGSESFV